MLVNVKNVVGSSRYPQSQDNTTWKKYWEEHAGRQWSFNCVCCDFHSADVGGHVHKVNEHKQYIIPMCRDCNAKGTDVIFRVDDRYLVPVVDN